MNNFSTAKFNEKQDPDLSFLEGKEILKVGMLNVSGFSNTEQEGGLAIDYVDNNIEKRFVLGFNELGVWEAWHGDIGKDNDEDVLKQKIRLVWDKLCNDKIHIVSKPFIRSYDFVNSLNEVILSLNIKELRMMSKTIQKYFSDITNIDHQDCDFLIGEIGFWVI